MKNKTMNFDLDSEIRRNRDNRQAGQERDLAAESSSVFWATTPRRAVEPCSERSGRMTRGFLRLEQSPPQPLTSGQRM
jgi:hypothetical protein